MSLLITIATAVPLTASLGVIWFTIRNLPTLAPPASSKKEYGLITVDELGLIEGSLPNLVRVLVVANKIEKPEGALGEAVEKNFRRHVHYLFLISKSKAASQKDGYYHIFEAYAHIHKIKKEMLDIKALPFEWDDFPIIFYQTRCEDGGLASVAFRGTELREGIATHYERVPTEYAHTIATSLLADAPEDIDVSAVPDRIEFDNGAKLNVVDINSRISEKR